MLACIIPSLGVDLIRQGWSRRGPNVLQEGYGSAAVLPEQGIYLAASIYRPVIQVLNYCLSILVLVGFFFGHPLIVDTVQFTDKVASMLPKKYSQLG